MRLPRPVHPAKSRRRRFYQAQPKETTVLKITVYAALLFAAAFALRQLDGNLPQVIPYAFALVLVPLVALHMLLQGVNA